MYNISEQLATKSIKQNLKMCDDFINAYAVKKNLSEKQMIYIASNILETSTYRYVYDSYLAFYEKEIVDFLSMYIESIYKWSPYIRTPINDVLGDEIEHLPSKFWKQPKYEPTLIIYYMILQYLKKYLKFNEWKKYYDMDATIPKSYYTL